MRHTMDIFDQKSSKNTVFSDDFRSKMAIVSSLKLLKNFQIWPVVFLMPLEVQGHTVPLLKCLMCGNMEVWGLRCGTYFILCKVLLKKSHFTTNETFQIRYWKTLYLKGHRKYDRSKLKVRFWLSKFRSFNFDLSPEKKHRSEYWA